MAWLTSIGEPNLRDHASVSEVVECFSDRKSLLLQLALLITGEKQSAEQSVVNACDLTAKGSTPFRYWLSEWAKAATIGAAINRSLSAIQQCEAAGAQAHASARGRAHPEDGWESDRSLETLLVMDPAVVISQLDPLARTVLVLRLALRYSLQDCVFRLNVSRVALVRAQSRALAWLDELHDVRSLATPPSIRQTL